MKSRILLTYLFMMLLGSVSVMAQTSSSEEDPFKNNPFFSKPLDELLNSKEKPDTTAQEKDHDHDSDHRGSDVRRYVHRINNEGLDFGGFFEAGPYSSNSLYASYPVMPMVHFNRVNGLFLGVREERMQWYSYNDFFDVIDLHPHGMIGYSFGQREWQYEAGLERYLGFNNRIMIGAEIYNATTTDDFWRVGLTETSFTSILAGYDYLDYYKQRGWGAYLLARSYRFFEGGVSYNQNQFNSLEVESDFWLFGKKNLYRPNPPVEIMNGEAVDTLDVGSLTFSASFNPKHILILPRFTFSLAGLMELADPGYGTSDYEYQKYTAEFISYLNIEPGAVIKYRLKAGSITGDAPVMKEFHLGGPGSLRAQPFKVLPFGADAGNRMLLSNAEIQFGSSDYWNDGWIDVDDFYISLFLDSGWTSDYTGPNTNALDGFSDFSFDKLEHSGGFGLGTNSIRGEIAWDLNNTDQAPIIWIRFNPTF
jgi:hypothetical protein